MPCLANRREVLGVFGRHVGLRRLFAQDFEADGVEQQAGGDEAVGRSFSMYWRAASTTHLRTSFAETPS